MVVREIGKIVFNVALYPTKDELRKATEVYLQENHPSFYNKFTQSRWIVFFESKIYQDVIFLYCLYCLVFIYFIY